MGKRSIFYIVVALLTLGLLMLLEYNKPKAINWFPSYVPSHKIPYGTFVLNDIAQDRFGEKLRYVNEPPFEFLSENSGSSGTYLFLNDYVEFGEAELDALLDWTAEGNTLFIASSGFERQLLDTLQLQIESLYGGFNEEQVQHHRLLSPELGPKKQFLFDRDDYASHFVPADSTETGVIGTVFIPEDDSATAGTADVEGDSLLITNSPTEIDSAREKGFNVIKKSFGQGEIILSTFPEAFTNYFILKNDNREYTAGLLSYLDGTRNIYWDNHYKAGKSFYTSPLYIFLNTKELKWAYYLVLIGALVYIIFEGKRKQRAIPVVLPLKNQTLAFTRTIGDMYYEKKEAKPIAEHKIAHFLEYIRSRFHLGTIAREEDFYRNLASRSGHSVEEMERLFRFLEQIRGQETITDYELQDLNKAIEKFKKRAETPGPANQKQ